MEAVNQHANESKVKYKITKGQPLHQVWNSLWEQCEEANEISNGLKMCLPRANKNVANTMKMLAVFHSEVQKRSDSEKKTDRTSDQDLCESCESSKSKQNLLEENYQRRGEIIEYLLSRLTAPLKMNERLKEPSFEKSNGTKAHSVKRSPVRTDTETPEVADIPLNQSTSLPVPAKGGNNLVNSFTMEDREEENISGTNMQRFKPTLAHIDQPHGYHWESCGSSKSKQKLLEEKYQRRGEIIEYLLSHLTAPLKMNERLKEPSFEKSNGTKAHSVKGSPVRTDTETPEVADIPLNQSTSLPVPAKRGNNLVNSFTKEDREEENISGTNMQRFKPTVAHTVRGYSLERETQSKENTTKTLVKLLRNFTKYDPSKDPFTNMSVFENECSQHNLGPRESCLIMKLWLPSQMSARLAAPVARPAGGPQFWSADYHWGDTLDRVKAVTHLVTGEDHLGMDILEDLTVTSQDDPWDFSRKFDQAFRLVMDVHDPNPPPALLKALVNKFNYLDRPTHVEASKEKTIEGIVRIVDSYQRNRKLQAASLRKNEIKCIREVSARDSIPKDEQPMRWKRESHN